MRRLLLALVLVVPMQARADGLPIKVVAAENFYGDVAAQLGGAAVAVTSILANPDQDPHMFEASPATARALAEADIAVSNGLDYDPWMARLLRAGRRPARAEIVVGTLLHRHVGENPHLWYDPAAMPAFAAAFVTVLDQRDPAGTADRVPRLEAFLASMKTLQARVTALRGRFEGTPVTATEPVFGLMASAVGLAMRNERFQLSVMNDTEPRVSDVAAFEADLRGRRVRVLLYNAQADDPASRRMRDIAMRVGVPIVPITETEPPGTTYQAWMTRQLDGLERALASQ